MDKNMNNGFYPQSYLLLNKTFRTPQRYRNYIKIHIKITNKLRKSWVKPDLICRKLDLVSHSWGKYLPVYRIST